MIGVFDSGTGGLTVLDGLMQRLPEQDFLYLGDHANAPYGHRGNAHIVDMTRAGVDFLMKQGCRLVILGCNTAAAVALRTLQQTWLEGAHPGKRILGVLVPMVEAMTGVPWHHSGPPAKAAVPHDGRHIALFATRKTIDSGAYRDEVAKRGPGIRLVQQACPGLVDAIEGGAGERPLRGLVHGYVQDLLDAGTTPPDAAVLGCTHFPLVRHLFAEALPDGTAILSQPDIVARSLADYMTRHPRFAAPARTGAPGVRLLSTGDTGRMPVGALPLRADLPPFEKVAL